MAKGPRVEIAALLGAVRAQLVEAQRNAKGSKLMAFGECELEVAIEFEAKGEAEVNLWAVKLGVGDAEKTTNKVRLKFVPVPGAEPAIMGAQIAKKGLGKSKRN